jgi:patatin-like phospholipase/acyl hydrolase
MKIVLSLCGGGIRGVYTARLLMYLDNELIKRRGKGIYHFINFFSGTSIGSIIAASIVYENRTGNYIDKLFNAKNAKKLMNKTLKDKILGYFQIRPVYNDKGKREFINNEFKDVPISKTNGKLILFTSYNVSTHKPIIFKSWEDDTGIGLVDALDMGSAAPGYYPTVKSKNGIVDTDGGIFANNPCIIAYTHALKYFKNDKDIRILSIGTGQISFKDDPIPSIKWGSIQWAIKGGIIDRIMDGPEYEVHNTMKVLTSAMKHTYYRINPIMEKLSTDDTSSEYINYMKKLADKDWIIHKDNIMKLFLEN